MTQTVTRYLSEAELVEKALASLLTSLGPMETTRFLMLAREERVESVLRHQQWQAGLEQESFFDQVFKPTNGDDSH